jgi:hypothetical protein
MRDTACNPEWPLSLYRFTQRPMAVNTFHQHFFAGPCVPTVVPFASIRAVFFHVPRRFKKPGYAPSHMHTPETRQKFVERRAQGWSYARIGTELGVAKSTLVEWSRQLRFELQNRRALELDDLQERLLGPRQHRAAQLAQKLSRVEDELSRRDLAGVSTARLFTLADALRRQIERETSGLPFVTPVKDIPAEEYVEEVQEWQP